jgi:glycosyltransferase involved in cell wall biosynthesis
LKEEDYEVIVVDNGSCEMLSDDYIKDLGPNFKYLYIKEAPASPAFAINFGVSHSVGKCVGIMIDGARILSPGVVKYALHAFKGFHDPIVATLGWHLGPDIQTRSVLKG